MTCKIPPTLIGSKFCSGLRKLLKEQERVCVCVCVSVCRYMEVAGLTEEDSCQCRRTPAASEQALGGNLDGRGPWEEGRADSPAAGLCVIAALLQLFIQSIRLKCRN